MKKSIADGKWQMEKIVFYLLILFLPTQLGKHFWPDFSYVAGLRIDYLSPTLYFTDILAGLLFVLWLIRVTLNIKSKKKIINLRPPPFTLPSLIIAVLVISYLLSVIVFSGEILRGQYFALKILEMGFIGQYVAKFAVSKTHFEKIILLFSTGVIFESILAIAQFINQGYLGGPLYFLGERSFTGTTPGIANASLNGELVLRPYATFPHPNVLAGYLLVVMILALFILRFRSPQNEAKTVRQIFSSLILNSHFLIQAISLVLGTIALILTMSRIAIFLWILILGRFFIRKLNFKAFVVGAFAALSLLSLSPFAARLTSIALTDEAIVQRITLVEASSQMIAGSPLFGVGLGGFIPALAKLSSPLTVATYLQPVHNVFLLVAAETGLIGLGIFIWLLWKTYLRIKSQESRTKKTHIVLLSVVLVTGLFDHYWLTLQQGQLMVAFVIGLCWSGIKPQAAQPFHNREQKNFER